MATFFATADEFAAWLERHGAGQTEFVVGYYKRGSKRPSMTWAESVDAALCFGWIDGVRKRIDEHSYVRMAYFNSPRAGAQYSRQAAGRPARNA